MFKVDHHSQFMIAQYTFYEELKILSILIYSAYLTYEYLNVIVYLIKMYNTCVVCKGKVKPNTVSQKAFILCVKREYGELSVLWLLCHMAKEMPYASNT